MTNLNRWDSFQEMLSLREAMNQLLEDSVVRGTTNPSNGRPGQEFVPAMDLSETPDAFVVEAALPGLKPENVNITVENNVLSISGSINQSSESKGRNFHRTERRYGSFQRSLALPNTVRTDAISAALEHGVLTLTLPKAEEVKPRQISIKVGEHNHSQAIEANR